LVRRNYFLIINHLQSPVALDILCLKELVGLALGQGCLLLVSARWKREAFLREVFFQDSRAILGLGLSLLGGGLLTPERRAIEALVDDAEDVNPLIGGLNRRGLVEYLLELRDDTRSLWIVRAILSLVAVQLAKCLVDLLLHVLGILAEVEDEAAD
jgi:hypothetical protein